ncbi:2-aminoethanethiol dioxygenase [Anopheles ziemanni]|uniref:2-aminoethanethiol dioxygenase n=1 Tax=Anopheles coustani TaxID=139045 RepID=UPI00265A06D0|nr:2-aminoethanethiol dioxygenase [Anopheles coustani]XP_058168269.1 2-aminoethanethiol dioxygenase [Anopheles ziemanni]XP_058168270.1 2-aminoethanethiol dioxygenase [Anopheles ziemanni]
MSALFARVFRQARQTFEYTSVSDPKFGTNLNALRRLVDQLTLADIGLDGSLVATDTFQRPTKAPCTYVGVFENDCFAMSVFVLRENYTMPLHDHPRMHGLLRVVSGAVQICSYSELARRDADELLVGVGKGQRHVLVAAEPEKIISSSPGDCALLTPTERNFHEITAIGGPAAFFDILSPPYNTASQPQYYFYRKVPVPRHLAELEPIGSPDKPSPLHDDERPRYVLETIPNPDHYYCDTVHYTPPGFMDYEEGTAPPPPYESATDRPV